MSWDSCDWRARVTESDSKVGANCSYLVQKKVVELQAGKYAFRLLHVEDTHSFGVSLGWRLPSGFPHQMKRKAPMMNIPPSAFTHTIEDQE